MLTNMCDLFGLSCNGKDRATHSLPLFGKYANLNRHGWGIAYYENNGAIVKRKAESALHSEQFHSTIDEAKSTKIYKDVLKNFPDAELIDVSLKREDEPNE